MKEEAGVSRKIRGTHGCGLEEKTSFSHRTEEVVCKMATGRTLYILLYLQLEFFRSAPIARVLYRSNGNHGGAG